MALRSLDVALSHSRRAVHVVGRRIRTKIAPRQMPYPVRLISGLQLRTPVE
jgi:hypothetical protein